MAKALGQNALSKIVNWAKNTFATKTEVSAIIPTSRGGTGSSNPSIGLNNLISGCSSVSGAPYEWYMVFTRRHNMANGSAEVVRFSDLMSYTTNRRTTIEAADTNYTTFMGRGIALQTSVPSSITNGCIVGVY